MNRGFYSGVCNCIGLYDYDPKTIDLKGWFRYMEQWAEDIGQPWESAGITTSARLIQFKNAKKKLEKTDFDKITEIELLGGVRQPGTNEDWKTYAAISCREREGLRETAKLCFANTLQTFFADILKNHIRNLLNFGDFKYGICYQRDFNKGPSSYVSGVIEKYGNIKISDHEEDQISKWHIEYTFMRDGDYRTGLLRDVYSFNLLTAPHLNEKVGTQSLQEWISSDPRHGTLEKLTDTHWFWSIDPEDIPAAQEILQEAGLLLCYKP